MIGSPVAVACSLLTALGVVTLLAAEAREHEPVRRVAKPLASAGFVGVALAQGALGSPFGRWILAALGLSMLGDVLLLGRRSAPFLAGLLAFLGGHVAYAGAFVVRGADPGWALGAAGPLAAVAVAVGRWLLPRVEPAMRAAVLAYVVVISAMVALAVGAFAASAGTFVLVGAVGFYLSDLSVARDRFVEPGFANRLWGLPLYYGAQLVFAWGLGGIG